MAISAQSLMVNDPVMRPSGNPPALRLPRRIGGRIGVLIFFFLLMAVASRAQVASDTTIGDKSAQVLEGVTTGNVYGVGKSIKINGSVKEGAIAFGGDVIVQGTVEGDVAAIGGSVIQLEGSRIGGDVFVVGGTYQHGDKTPNRNPASMTIM